MAISHFLKKKREKIQNIGVVPQKRDKNPKKYVQSKKKMPALENLVSCTFKVVDLVGGSSVINGTYHVELTDPGLFYSHLCQ